MDFPVEEFAKSKCFSVQGNSIELEYRGERVTLKFDSQGELFRFLSSWRSYLEAAAKQGAGPGNRSLYWHGYSARLGA